MSLNGDVTVIRNGRSTSTVSIYNYPEHLNPFYEDDQHKRLRFWPINKKGEEGRRNSFSLGGLKDMWAFKSFRSKKKSSTLGINKTSESPPTLRRVYPVDSSNLFNSYDRRARYSSNDAGDNFQRNAPYRSSLQNVHTTQESPNGIGLNRNDQYRSTIQFGNRTQSQTTNQTLPVPRPRRYVYGGSVTPQPLRNSEFGRGNTRDILTHGSSQTSISTNPFDSDNDEESEHHLDSASGAASLGGKRTPRKKRRAPAPPIPIHSTNGSSIQNRLSPATSQQPELRIEEDLDIANLTAEIESFVKTKSNETPEKEVRPIILKEVSQNKDAPKTNGTIPKTKPILKTSPNMVITKEFKPKPKTTELQIQEELKIEEKPALPEKKRIHQTAASLNITEKSDLSHKEVIRSAPAAQQTNQQIGNVECIHVHVESPRSTPERDVVNRVSSFKKEPCVGEKITAKTSFTLASPPTNRRESSNDTKVKQKIQVTETITIVKTEPTLNSAAKSNGVVSEEICQSTDAPAVVKPPIAAKPTIETKAKVNNFAVIHKPGRRIVLGSDAEEIPVSSPKIVDRNEAVHKTPEAPKEPNTSVTMHDTVVSEVKVVPKSNGTVPKGSIEVPTVADLNQGKLNTQTTSQKHVVFQEQDTNVDVVTVPEMENEKEKSKQLTEKLTVTLESEKEETAKNTANSISTPAASSAKTSTSNTTTTSSSEIVEPQENTLQIEEPTSSRSSIEQPTSSTVTPKPRTAILTESREEFEALYRNRPSSHAAWKQSTLAPLETHVPPDKRRSVKDIIESINRSQRLLHAAAHKDLPELITTRSLPPPSYSEVVDESSYIAPPSSNDTDNDFSQTLRTLDETQRELENMLPSTSGLQNGAAGTNFLMEQNTNDVDTQKPNNEEVFKKCRVNKEVYDYRETSPTASNLDWNPVPKPKRSKNRSDQREH